MVQVGGAICDIFQCGHFHTTDVSFLSWASSTVFLGTLDFFLMTSSKSGSGCSQNIRRTLGTVLFETSFVFNIHLWDILELDLVFLKLMDECDMS